jgi:tol-pal system protein YbgF
MKNLRFYFILALSSWAFAQSDPFSIEHTVPLAQAVDELREDIRTLQRLDLVSQVADLERKVQHLQGMVEEQAHTIASLKAVQPKPIPVVAPVDAHADKPVAVDGHAMYREALLHLKKKEYDQAKRAFSKFLASDPNSSYAANAYYWLGEIALVKGNFAEAKHEFMVIRKSYPRSPKVGDSLFKLGMISEEQGHIAEAKILYKKAIAFDEQSASGKLAQRALSQIVAPHGHPA